MASNSFAAVLFGFSVVICLLLFSFSVPSTVPFVEHYHQKKQSTIQDNWDVSSEAYQKQKKLLSTRTSQTKNRWNSSWIPTAFSSCHFLVSFRFLKNTYNLSTDSVDSSFFFLWNWSKITLHNLFIGFFEDKRHQIPLMPNFKAKYCHCFSIANISYFFMLFAVVLFYFFFSHLTAEFVNVKGKISLKNLKNF